MEFGTFYVTKGIEIEMRNNIEFLDFVAKCFARHISGDWGDLCEEDKELNRIAVIEGSRIFSAYVPDDANNKIYIITEADRSATTALFPHEY